MVFVTRMDDFPPRTKAAFVIALVIIVTLLLLAASA